MVTEFFVNSRLMISLPQSNGFGFNGFDRLGDLFHGGMLEFVIHVEKIVHQASMFFFGGGLRQLESNVLHGFDCSVVGCLFCLNFPLMLPFSVLRK